jgi:peptidoglycan hydrolase-like protein with peptidoglycan-binding domain
LSASDSSKPISVQLSESSAFTGASWVELRTTMSFTLSSGNGVKTVYARFRDKKGNTSTRIEDTIELVEKNGASGSVLGTTTLMFPANLTIGDRGQQVRALQEYLAAQKLFKKRISGVYGLATYQSVRAFQKLNGLPQTGKFDEVTRARANGSTAPKVQGALTTIPSPATEESTSPATTKTFDIDLSMDMESPLVRMLQEYLTKVRVYSGPITGYFGVKTFEAVKRYQASRGIVPTGYVGPKTRALLNAGK